MKIVTPFLIVVLLSAVAYLGVEMANLQSFFGIVLPYVALVLFLGGFVYRVVDWARSPVPFSIATTAGQQRSLPWLKNDSLGAPHSKLTVLGRMALEVFFFRSLFRNTKAGLNGKRLVYGEEKLLWAFGLLFHYSFLLVILRHTRFFAEPVPFFVAWLQAVDGFLHIGVPVVYLTTIALAVALLVLLARRVLMAQIHHISLPSDYFPLFLLLGIGTTGALMRHFYRVDVTAVKELALSLVALSPRLPDASVGALFYTHLFLVSTLLAYFPASKLMHAGGIFMSPTRNLASNSRQRRHVNPWNYPVPVHTFAEWQEEFRDKLEAADMPIDETVEHPVDAPAHETNAQSHAGLVGGTHA
ncbi:MAG: sulfate reduction electron transfer complex DsrMKJOP subunit DsrM [Chloroflexota bacterium]